MASTDQLRARTRAGVARAPGAQARPTATAVQPAQKHIFWASYFGWMLDGFDTTIYAFVLVPALKVILPASGVSAKSYCSASTPGAAAARAPRHRLRL